MARWQTSRTSFIGIVFLISQVIISHQLVSAADCTGLSSVVTCTSCDDYGRCEPGTVQVDPWLQNTLTTQMEVQLDLTFEQAQLLDAHNSFNNRAYGPLYGSNDTCAWPPPYSPTNCTGIANHEFSLTDLLNFGIRAIELDNWYCDGEMRIAHLGSDIDQECGPDHVLFSDAVQEIGEWLDDHAEAFIRIYMNEKVDQGNDDEVNGPYESYMGSRILTPADLRDTYNGEWPTLRTMRQAGKQVVIGHLATAGAAGSVTHGGKYIHPGFWVDFKYKFFTSYPDCGGKNDTNILRFYSDSTHYIDRNDGETKDGPTNVGYIADFTEFVKCRIQYPGADQITPDLMSTAVYTWAQGEPAKPIIDSGSCILLNSTDNRWYSLTNCSALSAYYACQSTTDSSDWTVSSSAGSYDDDTIFCPMGYRFGLPQNGYQHQKLLDSMSGPSVWLNVAPLLADYVPPTGRAHFNSISGHVVFVAAFLSSLLFYWF